MIANTKSTSLSYKSRYDGGTALLCKTRFADAKPVLQLQNCALKKSHFYAAYYYTI
jgi:hypothetical protein